MRPVEYVTSDGGFPVSFNAAPQAASCLFLHWTAIPARDFLLSVPCLKYTMNFPTPVVQGTLNLMMYGSQS